MAAANITILSGNGQMLTMTGFNALGLGRFLPMVVRVTDADGKPIPNKLVKWVILPGGGASASVLGSDTSQTGADGITSMSFSQDGLTGDPASSFVQTTVTATADAVSATFTKTQALSALRIGILDLVQVEILAPERFATVTGAAGSSGSPILVRVKGWDGGPIPNVSVRQLVLNSGDPGVSLQTGPGADPGSVLTDARGYASCTPIFGGTAGQGSFDVLVGGVDATPVSGTGTPVAYWQSWTIPFVVTPNLPIQHPGGVWSFQASRGGSTFYPGDTWTVRITGSLPNAPVAVQGGRDGASDITPTGATDANGNFTLSGTFMLADAGSWQETWMVGSDTVATCSFSLVPPVPPASDPNTPPPGILGQKVNAAFDSFPVGFQATRADGSVWQKFTDQTPFGQAAGGNV
jgi:hypothetical protein